MKSRLDKLEAKLGDGACPGPVVEIIHVGVGWKAKLATAPPLPEVCPLCGVALADHFNANGAPRVHRIEAVEPGENWPGK
jgi:hypothetical protein